MVILVQNYFKNLYTNDSKNYYEKLNKYLDNNEKKFIITANPETFMLSKKDKELEALLLNKENDIIPDGIAIVKAAKKLGFNVKERITGIDTTIKLLELLNNKKKSLYLFGAKKEVLDKLKLILKKSYPNIKILGMTDGYVTDKEKVFTNILKLQPDVILVALGIPIQEKLIGKYINEANKGIFMGVGGVFDVLSGSKKRAPKMFIKLNLEWLYRITKEPYRLKRFYQNNIKFMWEIYKNK